MLNKLKLIIVTFILFICSSTSFAGLLDGTYWTGTKIDQDLAFYEDFMYVRSTNRDIFHNSIFPYLSIPNLNGTITYLNYFPEFLIPELMWGRCNIDKGVASYNAIGMLFYAIPLFEHIKPCKFVRTNWTPPKTAGIIDSFRYTGDSLDGLAFDGEYLWIADSGSNKIYKLDTSGHEIISFDSPDYKSRGLAFDGTYLWLSDTGGEEAQGMIYKLTTSGTVIDSFSSPGPNPTGLAFDETYLWCSDWEESKIYKLDIFGNVVDYFDAPGGSPADLAFDGTYLWSLSRITLLIYKLDTSGNVIESFYSPATFDPYNTFNFPTGLAWDGKYLWVAYNLDYDPTIYKYEVTGEE
jgi:hypothetical protein